MTWTDETSASTPGWVASGATNLTWTTTSVAATGNYNRMIQAVDFVASGQRGVDFVEWISITNPFSVTSASPVAIRAARNEP